MQHRVPKSQSLFMKLMLGVGAILLFSMGCFALFSISYVKKHIMHSIIVEADRFSNTIKLGTHYTMMTNVREDITRIINDIATQENVVHIRIFHKQGDIVFSNKEDELGTSADITDYACTICHKFDHPPHALDLEDRTRIITLPNGGRLLGIVSPIYNEPSCSSADCHAHSPETTILGTLDVVISLDQVDAEALFLGRIYFVLAILSFLITSVLIFLYLNRFVSRPVKKMIAGTEMISKGKGFNADTIKRNDEMGLLATAISSMGQEIFNHQDELNKTNEALFKANRDLEKLSITDELTGLANRRFLFEKFSSEYERAKRYHHNISVLLIDVDFFKKVNDRYGHICGDTVLKELSFMLRENVRNTDLVARYGGEEIVILLPETNNNQAAVMAEKIRRKIESHTIICENDFLSITVSIGIATYPNIDFADPMKLLNAADQALYKAKKNGRNKVVSCSAADFL